MIPTLTQLQIVNRALVEIAQGQPLASGDVSTQFDGSANGIYAAEIYQGALQMLLRQQDYEFSRVLAPLTPGGTPGPGWTYSYIYPLTTVRVRQVQPASPDPYDPQPCRWEVAYDGTQQVIWTDQVSAWATMTTNQVTEGQFSDIFTEQFVRYLGSILAMPVAGRPDFSKEMLDLAGKLGAAGMDRDS